MIEIFLTCNQPNIKKYTFTYRLILYDRKDICVWKLKSPVISVHTECVHPPINNKRQLTGS